MNTRPCAAIRPMKHGWTAKDKEQLWAWYESASRWEGGYSFVGYLDYMVQELVELLTEQSAIRCSAAVRPIPFPPGCLSAS